MQMNLMRHAATGLKEGGKLWYMTYSILNDEKKDLWTAFAMSVVFV